MAAAKIQKPDKKQETAKKNSGEEAQSTERKGGATRHCDGKRTKAGGVKENITHEDLQNKRGNKSTKTTDVLLDGQSKVYHVSEFISSSTFSCRAAAGQEAS